MPTPFTTPSRWSTARRFVVAVAAAIAGIVWAHAIAAVVRGLATVPAPATAFELTLAAVGLAVLATVLLPSRLAEVAVAAWGGVAMLMLLLFTGVLAGPAAGGAVRRPVEREPDVPGALRPAA